MACGILIENCSVEEEEIFNKIIRNYTYYKNEINRYHLIVNILFKYFYEKEYYELVDFLKQLELSNILFLKNCLSGYNEK